MTTDPISAITNPIVSDATATGSAAASGTKSEAPKSGTGAPSTDSGEVSHAQNLLNTINAMANNIPTIDQQRVDQIQSALAQGKLQTNPQDIAKNLMEMEKLLSGAAGQS